MSEAKSWEKLPQETAKAFKAFQVYLQLVDHANPAMQTRSVRRVCEVMNYNPNSVSNLELWCTKYDWVARAASYDAHMSSRIIEFKSVELAEYQAKVVGSLTQQLTLLDHMLNRKLIALKEELDNNKHVDPIELKRMVEAVRLKDDLARRAGRMPTAYIREQAQDDEDVEFIYVIGSND